MVALACVPTQQRGAELCVAVQVDEQGRIVESCFKTFGCGSAIASSSVATEWCAGSTPVPALQSLPVTKARPLSLKLALASRSACVASLTPQRFRSASNRISFMRLLHVDTFSMRDGVRGMKTECGRAMAQGEGQDPGRGADHH